MKQKQDKQKNEQQQQQSKKAEKFVAEAVPAIVEEVIGRTGFRGEITQIKCRLLDGKEKGRTMTRNVKGPIQINDILVLRETQIEARRIRSKVTKGAFS